jgi:hypothetical protein
MSVRMPTFGKIFKRPWSVGRRGPRRSRGSATLADLVSSIWLLDSPAGLSIPVALRS